MEQKKEYLNKDLFSSAREINKRIEKEEKRKRIKEILKDLLDFFGLFLLFCITYNLLLLIAYLIR
jgi:Ribonuclease G/E